MSDKSTRLEQKTESLKAPSALTLYESLATDGSEILSRPLAALAWCGFSAGLSMGLSAIGICVLYAELATVPGRALLTSAGSALGYFVVIMGRQGLIAETAIVVSLPVIDRISWRLQPYPNQKAEKKKRSHKGN